MSDIIAAVSTGRVVSAIGIVRLSGEGCIPLAFSVFTPRGQATAKTVEDRKLILGATGPGDIVLDPFSGSGTTLVVAQQLQRLWIGCEKEREYNTWAIDRIDRVPLRPVEAWMELDRENARRRESIR